MKKFRQMLILFLCALMLVTPLSGCGARKTNIEYVIGISLANLREQWRLVLKSELEAEAAKYGNIRLVTTDAADDWKEQEADVQRLLSYGIDLLIISPSDVEALTPVISQVYAKIPVIVLDRAVEGYDYTLFIGPDNELIGRQVGQTVLDLLKEADISGGEVLELKNDSYACQHRSAEFTKMVSAAGVHTNSVNLREATRDCAEDYLLADPSILEGVDVIFAHNDYMAYGARLALERLARDDIKIIGLDGFTGETGGLELVSQGLIDATVTCPTGGTEAIQNAVSILNQVSGVPKQVILRSYQIRPDNVDAFQRQPDTHAAPDKIHVGYAQIQEESHWRDASTESIIQAAKALDIDLTIAYSEVDVDTQIQQVREFIAQKMDVIVVSPVVQDGWENVLMEAREAGIPVLLVDRMVDQKEDMYTAFIGADFEEEGRRCARWMMNQAWNQETVRILELRGTEGSSPAQQRKEGFEEAIAGTPRYQVVYSASGDFSPEGGSQVIRDYLARQPWDIDVIFSHNDDMALGAIEVLNEYGIQPGVDVKILSIDGTSNALSAIQKGALNCVVECNPLLGPQLMKAISDLMEGKELPLRIITDESVFTVETPAELMKNRKY